MPTHYDHPWLICCWSFRLYPTSEAAPWFLPPADSLRLVRCEVELPQIRLVPAHTLAPCFRVELGVLHSSRCCRDVLTQSSGHNYLAFVRVSCLPSNISLTCSCKEILVFCCILLDTDDTLSVWCYGGGKNKMHDQRVRMTDVQH